VADVYEFGSLPRLASLIAAHRRAAEKSGCTFLALFGGDWVSPYPLAQLDHGAGMTQCLRMAGLTHTCLGNHEADIPPHELAARLREWQGGRGVVLNSNLPGLDEALGMEGLREREIVRLSSRDGSHSRTVCLLGVVVTEPSLYVDGLDFAGCIKKGEDPNDRVMREVQDGGWDLVLPLTHQDLAADVALANSAAGRLKVVLGGHDHDALKRDEKGCLVLKPGADAHSAMVVDFVWGPTDKAPRVTRSELVPVEPWPVNVALRSVADSHMARTRLFEEATLLPASLCPLQLSSQGVRLQQTVLGGVLCNSIREVAGVDAVLLEAGCVRAQKDYGAAGITVADLRAELPWDTELALVRMKGSELELALSSSRSHHPREFAGWLQHDTGIVIVEGELVGVAGEAFDPERYYLVAAIFHSVVRGMDDNPGYALWRERVGVAPTISDCPPAKQLVRIAFARAIFNALPSWEELVGAGASTSALTEESLLPVWMDTFGSGGCSTPGISLAIGRLLEAADIDGDGTVSLSDYECLRFAARGTFPLEHVFRLQERSPAG